MKSRVQGRSMARHRSAMKMKEPRRTLMSMISLPA